MADRKPGEGYGWQATAQGNGKHASFHIWAAYSFSPNASWGQLASEFLECKNDRQALQTFVNTALGECWKEDQLERLGAEGLKARVETYKPNTIPEKGLVLVGAIDVQDNRVAIGLYAYGRDEERWVVSHQEIFGDPGKPELWKQVDDVILRKYPHESGVEMRPSVVTIDSGGHYTHEVYQYARERKRLRNEGVYILAIKGMSQKDKPAIGKPTLVDVNYKGISIKAGVELYPVGVHTIKNSLYAHLKIKEPGPRYVHFHSELNTEFFDQMTSEKKIVRYLRNGNTETEWAKKPGTRNEAWGRRRLRARVDAVSLHTIQSSDDLDQLEKKIGVKKEAPKVTEPPPENVAPREKVEETPKPPPQNLKTPPNPRRLVPNRRPGGFITNY